ncbi:GH92 family glycosyl hydrolase [Seonamhaeicola sp.]|uniref:GH92 family glycosyl hydrolase n=1 Tax=Seonamhaeicola sp. TaxID=1912245 RepID=UPI00260B02E9|nr:GH92 family glycosyl hydrolase [Seonamhaeicola sp.]
MKRTRLYIKSLLLILFVVSCNSNKEERANQDLVSQEAYLSEMVYPTLDTENSRWFFFSSACRPFGMVNLNPDTEIDGAWGSGYRYKTDTIKGFSHIHAWQISGVSVMPVTIPESHSSGIFSDFYSKFKHENEEITPGYHKVELDRYKIKAELTSTKRVGFHKYTYPENTNKHILFNLNTILGPCENGDGELVQLNETEFAGSVIAYPTKRRPKPLKIYFKVVLNKPVDALIRDEKTKNYALSFKDFDGALLMKIGISYTSLENAALNIQKELPHWDFEGTIKDSREAWSDLLGRIVVEGGTDTSKQRFYTDLWHALQGRRIISDVNGAYPDNTRDTFKIGQLPLDEKGIPLFNHYNSDALWGAQWTLNTLWGLVYPEIYEEFVLSFLQYYKDGGLVPRGPSGGNYTYVMTGNPATPFFVSAIQKGIIKSNHEYIYQALKKNHLSGGIMEKAGYEHNTFKGGGLQHYLKEGFVPHPNPQGKFGIHQDGAGLTLEYAYQDWTLAQLAKKLGHQEDHAYFVKRSKNYHNVFNKESGWMRAKDSNEQWISPFDPYQYENGFIESNAAQSTWFVPHDLQGLALLMGGMDKAIEKLNEQFKQADLLGFTSGSSHAVEGHPEYRRIPINYGNQPSIQTAFVFSGLSRPDLTQYWSRKVATTVFGGLSPATGYNGDEDQGLMGSLAVLMKIGLFQVNGGTDDNPEYQIGSPGFDKVTIQLNPDYYSGKTLVIKAENNSEDNVYVNHIHFNDKAINDYKIDHKQLTNGGLLNLKMSNNK